MQIYVDADACQDEALIRIILKDQKSGRKKMINALLSPLKK